MTVSTFTTRHLRELAQPGGALVRADHAAGDPTEAFRSVHDLVRKIDRYVINYNAAGKPFVRTATTDSTLAKLQRLCEVICGTLHRLGFRTRSFLFMLHAHPPGRVVALKGKPIDQPNRAGVGWIDLQRHLTVH